MVPGDFIKHFTVLKTPWDNFTQEDKKSYLPYIINLWLSMAPELIEVINEVQQQQVPNRDHYNFYLKVLPKKSLRYQWIKAKKKEYNKDVISRIASFYNVGTQEIYDSIGLLDEEKIINILQQQGLQDKMIKQLLKQ